MGLDVYLNQKDIPMKSNKYCHIRSAYNQFGLNNWLKSNFNTTLFDILPSPEKASTNEDGYIYDWDRKKFLNWAINLQKKVKTMKESVLYIYNLSEQLDITSIEEKFENKKGKTLRFAFCDGILVKEIRTVKGFHNNPAVELTVKITGKEHKSYLKDIDNIVKFGKLAVKYNAGILISA